MNFDFPLYEEIAYLEPLYRYSQINTTDAVWLDSSDKANGLGRYSYIAFEPLEVLRLKDGFLNQTRLTKKPTEVIRDILGQVNLQKISSLPPFQGGIAGFFSYDFGRYFEDFLHLSKDELGFDDFYLGVYDLVIAFDHISKRSFLFSTGGLTGSTLERRERAAQRLTMAMARFEILPSELLTAIPPKLAIEEITSTEDSFSYKSKVEAVIEKIYAGDIFEANISQRFKANYTGCPKALYAYLREVNPAPFSAFCQFAHTQILSSSPERFIQVHDGQVQTRPIKGTALRDPEPKRDIEVAQSLLKSEKDRAENIMIVDLMRNDLSKVCRPHTVEVPVLCGVETYATVHHLVSCVQGKLKSECDIIDLLEATFPGGSITGAPKIQAMSVIEELEPFKRGPYCGAIGYLAFNGDMDLNIAIRTISIKDQVLTFGAGGAVTADSDPHLEYLESLNKARALIQCLTR